MQVLHLRFQRFLQLLYFSLRLLWILSCQASFFSHKYNIAYAVEIRLIIEKLGLSYLKLGQFLATRFDILPAELCNELNKLYETVPPLTFQDIKNTIESELDQKIELVFSFFDCTPIAAGSVAQVHEARMPSGEKVVVKIQRPEIQQIFNADIYNIKLLASVIDKFRLLGKLSFREVMEEFEIWTRQELDFTIEAQAAEKFNKNSAEYEIIPQIYWEFTTSKILTMQFIDGVSLAEVSRLLESGGMDLLKTLLPKIDITLALHHLVFAILRQFFVTGFFHGDPHPGNILIRSDNTIAFVDFGIFGTLNTYQQKTLVGYIENMALGNIDNSFRYYSKLLTSTTETDLRAFELDAKIVLSEWRRIAINSNISMTERHFGKFAGEMFAVVNRHHLRMSMDTLLFWRSIYMMDCNTLFIDTKFNLLHELETFFRQLNTSPIKKIMAEITDINCSLAVVTLMYKMPEYSNNFLAQPTTTCVVNHQTERFFIQWLIFPIMMISMGYIAIIINVFF